MALYLETSHVQTRLEQTVSKLSFACMIMREAKRNNL